MPPPPRHGLAEYLVVVALFTIAAAGAVTLFRDPIRAFFGASPSRSRAAQPVGGGR